MFNLKVLELTKENEGKYLDKLAQLEVDVLEFMNKEGKQGQLFITGKEDISEYVHSKENTVIIGVDEKENVRAATYITQGQVPYTYNDITKYFKYGKEYMEHIKSEYSTEHEYKKDMLEIYKLKLEAFRVAKEKMLKEHPEFNGDIMAFLARELNDEENKFHEKSELRENLNKYMSQYIISKNKEEKYDKFYWITSSDISKEFNKEIQNKSPEIEEYENFMKTEQEEYSKIMQNAKLKIYEKSKYNPENYYGANTKNSIEIDTYITHPEQRSSGTARILVYEGVKKHIERHFKNTDEDKIYLCSTLHRDNLSSKYISEFFGLEDNIYLQRRQGRNREVHICKIDRKDYKNYLEKIQDKLILMYNYNPTNKKLSPQRKVELLKDQKLYETKELSRLNKIRKTDKNFTKNSMQRLTGKVEKLEKLNKLIDKYEEEIKKGETHER